MSSLIYELTKQSVSLERLDKLDGVLSSFRNDQFSTGTPVSYTHLTLPTIYSV